MPTDTADFLSSPQRINPTATLTADAPANENTFTLDDTSFFRIGDAVVLIPNPIGNPPTQSLGIVVGVTTTTISTQYASTLDAPKGSVIELFPSVQVTAQFGDLPVQVNPQPFDFAKSQIFNPGQTPALTVAPPSNQSVVVQYALAGINQNGTTAYTQAAELLVSGQSPVWTANVGVMGTAGTKDNVQVSGVAYGFLLGNTVTLQITGGVLPANIFGILSIAGYYK